MGGEHCLILVEFFVQYSTAVAQVKPVLDKLKDDGDVDVKYFAIEATTGTLSKLK